MDLDQVFTKLGVFGPYQMRLYHLYSMLALSVAFHHLAQVFLGGHSDHWCAVPDTSVQQQINCTYIDVGDECGEWGFSIPQDDPDTYVNEHQCRRYMSYQNLTDDTPLIECTHGYEFDHSQYVSTIQEDFSLVCNDKAQAAVAQSVYFGGVLVGSIVFGSLADWIGRKPTIIICVVIQCCSGLATSFVGSFVGYSLLRFITGTATMGIFLVVFTLVTEMTEPKWRTVIATVVGVYWSVGIMVLSLIAYFIRDWRKLEIALTVPAVFTLFYLPFLPESLRWLMSRGLVTETEAIIRKAAKLNKINMPHDAFLIVNKQENSTEKKRTYTIVDLFRSPNLRKHTINIMFNWFVIVMVYYGLSLSTSNLGLDPYTIFMLNGFLENPAHILSLFAIDRFGRRRILSLTMLSSAVCCFATVFLSPGAFLVTVAMLGKFAVTAAFGIVYVHSAEIFPTPIRSVGMGLASMSGRLGSVISPLVLLFSDWWNPLPIVLFSSLSITSAFVCLFLPETVGKKLPETIMEGENIGMDQVNNKDEKYNPKIQDQNV